MKKSFPQPHDDMTVHEYNEMMRKKRRSESNRLTDEERILYIKSLQGNAPIVICKDDMDQSMILVSDPKLAWRNMRDPLLEIIATNAIYEGKPVYLFRCKEIPELPW